MTPDIEDADEEKPDAIKDLEAIDAALGELEDNGTDADVETLEGAIEVVESLLDTAEESGEDDTDAYDALVETHESLTALIDGEATEDDVNTAGEMLATVGQQLQLAMLEAALAGAGGGGAPAPGDL
jgi:hypothetical protein